MSFVWEPGMRPSETELMHWGIPGMKHGRRRYQNEDGTWTEAGLAERRKREGFGESRKERRAEKAAERAERKAVKKAAKQKAREELAEERRRNNVKTMTDEELRAKIERVKMEQEYKELTRSPALKAGEKFITDYFANKTAKEERAYNDKKEKLSREHEMAKLKEQTEQAKIKAEADKETAKANAARAEADKERANTDRIDIEKGTRMKSLKNQAKQNKLQAKRYHSDYTILGGVKKMVNKALSGRGDATAEIYKGYGESKAAYNRGKTDAKIAVKQNKMLTRRNRKLDPYEEKASIRESEQNYWQKTEPKEKNKNKKKKGGES